nr:hypothetical protein CFP56_03844 [Quercus suber]
MQQREQSETTWEVLPVKYVRATCSEQFLEHRQGVDVRCQAAIAVTSGKHALLPSYCTYIPVGAEPTAGGMSAEVVTLDQPICGLTNAQCPQACRDRRRTCAGGSQQRRATTGIFVDALAISRLFQSLPSARGCGATLPTAGPVTVSRLTSMNRWPRMFGTVLPAWSSCRWTETSSRHQVSPGCIALVSYRASAPAQTARHHATSVTPVLATQPWQLLRTVCTVCTPERGIDQDTTALHPLHPARVRQC